MTLSLESSLTVSPVALRIICEATKLKGAFSYENICTDTHHTILITQPCLVYYDLLS